MLYRFNILFRNDVHNSIHMELPWHGFSIMISDWLIQLFR